MFVCDEVARCLELFPWRQMDKTDELWEYLSVVFRHRIEVDMPLITVFMILEEYWLAEKAGGRVSAFRVCHTWHFYFSRLHTMLAFYSGWQSVLLKMDDPGLLMRHGLKVYKLLFSRRLQHCPTKCLVDDMGNVLNLKYIAVKMGLDSVLCHNCLFG